VRYFERLESGVDLAPILAEIERQPEAWLQQTGRQERSPAQRDTAAIPIRGLRKSRIHLRRRRDVHESRFTGLSCNFPAAVSFIRLVALERDAELGRTKIVRLNAGARVQPHIDRGAYYACRDRLHLVLKSPAGSLLRAGDEEVRMREGELWWFDNKEIHEAFNEADVERIHLIFDLLPLPPRRARSHRDAPQVLAANAGRALEDVLADARARATESADRIVEQGVRLYLAGREQPQRWQRLVGRYLPGERDSLSPFRAVTRLLLEGKAADMERDTSLAMAWALERLETGGLHGAEIADHVYREGGVRAVARAWRVQRAGEAGEGAAVQPAGR
jgi:hypothetical protein